MMSQANGWLRRWLINPVAFRFSVVSGKGENSPLFSVADVLNAPGCILVIPDSRAGGLFLGAPQFWAIRHRYPNADISLLVHARQEYIAKKIPFVNNVIAYEDFLLPLGPKLRNVVQRLQESKFDIAFCFTDKENFCPAYLCYRSDAHLRVGFQRDDFPFFNVRIVPRQTSCYEPERLSLLLRTLGIPEVKEKVSWSVSRKGAEKIRQRFLVGKKEGERFIGLDVSSSTGGRPGSRQLQGIAEAASTLPNTRVLVFFDYAQRKTANQIKEALLQKALLFQTDDLPKIVALLEACQGLVACNTDLFHLAVVMGRSVVGIFPSADVARWITPGQEDVKILEHETLKGWNAQQLTSAVQDALSTGNPPESSA